MTFGSSNDHGAVWSPDASRIVFLSDRDGRDDIYLLEADDPDHPKLTDAHRFKTTRLTDTKEAEHGVNFSPDGKRVSFVRAGKLWTMTPEGKNARAIVDDVQVFVDPKQTDDTRIFSASTFLIQYSPAALLGGKIEATHVDAVAQFRPWGSKGFFMKGGAGMAFVRNWVQTLGPHPNNQKALSVVIGGGWEFRSAGPIGVQLFAMQHVGALGDLQTTTVSFGDVTGNFWSLGAAIVIR